MVQGQAANIIIFERNVTIKKLRVHGDIHNHGQEIGALDKNTCSIVKGLLSGSQGERNCCSKAHVSFKKETEIGPWRMVSTEVLSVKATDP